jgi:hypothetical protein
MQMRWLVISLICFAAAGCGGGNEAPEKQSLARSLIHPFLFQEELYGQLNFPYWFDDSIARKEGIRQIVRVTYASFETDPDSPRQRETFPRTKTIYTFSPEGRLVHLSEIHFADGIEISRSSFSIEEVAENGLFTVERLDTSSLAGGFMLMDQVAATKKAMKYRTPGGRNVIYLPDPNYWGTLSVDSLASPGAGDWIVQGTPRKPFKRYQVRNIVTERNVTHYAYFRGGFPKQTVSSDYPFRQKRSFVYNGKGIFCGYVDSTFMDNVFVTRNITTFELDGRDFPVEIVHSKGLNSEGSQFRTVEKLSYVTFTSRQ